MMVTNQISFTDDELPPEGKEHTLTIHIIVKFEDMIVTRVLIDNGSTLNACSMSTLVCLNVDTSLIRPTTIIIRAFDGTLREPLWPHVFHGQLPRESLATHRGCSCFYPSSETQVPIRGSDDYYYG